jgi:hypothetical protein
VGVCDIALSVIEKNERFGVAWGRTFVEMQITWALEQEARSFLAQGLVKRIFS